MQICWLLAKERLLKNPNFWTWLRICGTPFVILFLFRGFFYPALALFLLLAFTDFIDGWAARKFKKESGRGTWFDPLADKILVYTVLFYFVASGIALWWLFLLLLFRDVYITYKRKANISHGVSMPANWLGKCKTALQYAAVAVFMQDTLGSVGWGNLLLIFSGICAYASGYLLLDNKQTSRVTL